MSKIYIIKTGITDYIEGNLNFITNGTQMFYDCYNIITFTSDLSSLTDGNSMFNGCENLTSFKGDLSSLTNGTQMFYYCYKLTTFTSDLSSLTDGNSMFGSSAYNCPALDLASVQNIAETINNLASQGKTGTIHIGMSISLQSDDETAPVNVALAAIRAKGWTVNELYSSKL